ncbi:unnamed protein product, partial [Aphanomyces euteiches]
MKKPKASTPECSLLPLDIFIKIAFYLPGAADLFAFREALRPYSLLGPLEHLYKLSSLRDLWRYLWPRLVIPRAFNSWSTSYEAIANGVAQEAFRSTKIEWVVNQFPNSVSEIADE